MSRLEEQKLLELMRLGDQKAFKQIYQENRIPFFSWIRKQDSSLDQENTKELYQDIMIVFHKKVFDGLVLTSSIQTFLFGISKFKTKELKRKRKKTIYVEDIDKLSVASTSIDVEFENEDETILIMQQLKKIGKSCQKILEDFYLRGMTMKEIAIEFDYSSEKVARSRKHKCLKRLKELTSKSLQHGK